MSIKTKVMTVYRKYIFEPPISQLRLGRIVGMEHKDLLDDYNEQGIIDLLTDTGEQVEHDNRRMAEITLRKQQNANW